MLILPIVSVIIQKGGFHNKQHSFRWCPCLILLLVDVSCSCSLVSPVTYQKWSFQMHFHPSRTFSASLARLLLARRPDVRLTFSFLRLVRVLLVALLLGGFALGGWSGVARAATRTLPSTASRSTTLSASPLNHPSATTGSSLPSNFVLPHVATPTNPYDTGLGVLSFYTYIKHPLNTCACGKKELLVNVATGNLVLQSVEMQIHGTGEDLSLDAYYNSQPNSNAYQEMGTNWNLSVGRQVYLDTSHVATDVILYGSSNYDTYFAHNGDGSFTSPPGINATLVDNHNNTYTLTYHSSGQQWLFGTNGSLSSITDKNGNRISVSESGTLTSSITDTPRVVSSRLGIAPTSSLASPTRRGAAPAMATKTTI